MGTVLTVAGAESGAGVSSGAETISFGSATIFLSQNFCSLKCLHSWHAHKIPDF
jgi:hypothetical protein